MWSRRSFRFWGPEGHPFTPVVWWILVINVSFYLLELVFPRTLISWLGLNPSEFWHRQRFWTPVTYMFLHGGFLHLFFNMLILIMFGTALEGVWGSHFFLRYYLITGIGAGLCNVLFTPNAPWTIIGASGAMFGLLAAYGLLFPNNIVYFYLLIPIKAKYLVILFGLFEFFASLRPGTSPVAHLAHLGGMVIGLVYLLHYKFRFYMTTSWRSLQDWIRHRKQRQERDEEEELRREIDMLLDKVHQVGYEHLSSWEKRRLNIASQRLREMEKRHRWV